MFITMFGTRSCPRPARRVSGTPCRFARLALAASAALTAPLAPCQDVLLDLPAPRPAPVRPVTDAPTPPEPLTPPPATDAAPAPAATVPDAEMLTDDETGPAAGPDSRPTAPGNAPRAPKPDKAKAGGNKTDGNRADKPKTDTQKAQKSKGDTKGDGKGAKKQEETNDCCGRPGMIPVCRCVPITKKKSHTEYDTKCELVCVPGCGLLHGHCLGGHGSGHAPGCCDDGCPSCADVRIRQRKTLQKRVTEKEYDSYEFKIEWVPARCAFGGCTGCAGGGHGHGGFLDWLLSHE